MPYRQKREVVQELSPEALQKLDIATWSPHLSKIEIYNLLGYYFVYTNLKCLV